MSKKVQLKTLKSGDLFFYPGYSEGGRCWSETGAIGKVIAIYTHLTGVRVRCETTYGRITWCDGNTLVEVDE